MNAKQQKVMQLQQLGTLIRTRSAAAGNAIYTAVHGTGNGGVVLRVRKPGGQWHDAPASWIAKAQQIADDLAETDVTAQRCQVATDEGDA